MRSSPASIYITVLVSRSINMLSVTDFVPKGIISGVRVQAVLHLDMLDADRLPNMQSAFLPELHRWISKLIARHLHACPPGDLLITMVKETVILYKKSFENEKKKVVSLLDLKEMKARNDCEIACDCVKRANVFYMYAYVKKSSPGSTQLPTSRHLLSPSQPLIVTSVTYIHTRINRLWSPLAYGLGGNKMAGRHGAPRPPMTDVWHRNCFPTRKSASISEKVNIS